MNTVTTTAIVTDVTIHGVCITGFGGGADYMPGRCEIGVMSLCGGLKGVGQTDDHTLRPGDRVENDALGWWKRVQP